MKHGPADFKFEIPNLRFSGPCFIRGSVSAIPGDRAFILPSSCPAMIFASLDDQYHKSLGPSILLFGGPLRERLKLLPPSV
jgi:hypothetical protein